MGGKLESGDRNGELLLVQQLQGGNLTALGELYTMHKDMVYRTALAVTHNTHMAEDILQECFVRLYTYAASVDYNRPLKPWLYRVTVNLAYDCSAQNRGHQPLDDILEWLAGLPGNFPAPDHKAEEKETRRLVRDLIAKLPAGHRTVIVLFYMENLSVEEIAQVLELPEGTVKSRLHYARERMRESLARHQQVVPEMTYEFT